MKNKNCDVTFEKFIFSGCEQLPLKVFSFVKVKNKKNYTRVEGNFFWHLICIANHKKKIHKK